MRNIERAWVIAEEGANLLQGGNKRSFQLWREQNPAAAAAAAKVAQSATDEKQELAYRREADWAKILGFPAYGLEAAADMASRKAISSANEAIRAVRALAAELSR